MMGSNTKKTHPMVLVAATAMTIFSLVGSAAMTGLLPVAHTYRPDLAQELITDPNAAMVISNILTQDTNEAGKNESTHTCLECGTIISIRSFTSHTNNSDAYHINDKTAEGATYIIKVRMSDGHLYTFTQYNMPHYSVGDSVKLKSGRLVNA
ncbi:hypothetical protein [Methylobacillus sp.]|uniref:hypothetical protein n=1 Tax=Methylobacillus sp. TaxID=56818 RepID=UPI0012C11068|nr:hypothetical protein [Methylobacillus sp.]MPS48110.1 hypothetical protein [Methylobacillus sp.]